MHEDFEEMAFIEPSYEMDHAPGDIVAFIGKLKNPEKEICRMLFVGGEDPKVIADRFNMPVDIILQRVRAALAPLARDFGISVTFDGRKKSDGLGHPLEGRKRYSRPPKSRKSPREVAGK